MTFKSLVTINDDLFAVEWRCGPDPEDCDDEILDCPEEMVKRYGEPMILYVCKCEEMDKSKERKIDL
jgi:hypothetical protein